jgi:TPR repeat protein
MLALGLCFEEGCGVEANPPIAFRWYVLAAQNGNEKAFSAMEHVAAKEQREGFEMLELSDEEVAAATAAAEAEAMRAAEERRKTHELVHTMHHVIEKAGEGPYIRIPTDLVHQLCAQG